MKQEFPTESTKPRPIAHNTTNHFPTSFTAP